jgi:catabolite regulation protein CreA
MMQNQAGNPNTYAEHSKSSAFTVFPLLHREIEAVSCEFWFFVVNRKLIWREKQRTRSFHHKNAHLLFLSFSLLYAGTGKNCTQTGPELSCARYHYKYANSFQKIN